MSRTRGFKAVAILAVFVAMSITARSLAQPVSVINVIPNAFSAETTDQAETNIAVNTNAQANRWVVISSFGTLPTRPAGTNPYFTSSTNGTLGSWFNAAADNIPHLDTSLAFSLGPNAGGAQGTLYAARLFNSAGATRTTEVLRDTGAGLSTGGNPNSIPGSQIGPFPAAQPPDQPWIVTNRGGPNDRLYIGFNNFNAGANPPKASMYVSPTGGDNTFGAPFQLDPTANPNGNAIRFATAVDNTGAETVYALYQRYTGAFQVGGRGVQGQVMLRRDDAGALNGNPMQSLNGQNGRNVYDAFAPGTTRELTYNGGGNGAVQLGTERIGSDIAIACARNNPNSVYVAVSEVEGANKPVVHIYRSTDKGNTWAGTQFQPAASCTKGSAEPTLAVLDNGAVGVLYYGVNNNNRFEVHFQPSVNGTFGDPGTDVILAEYRDTGAFIGDYMEMEAMGNAFYGSFVAQNDNRGAGVIGYNPFPQGVGFDRAMAGGLPNGNVGDISLDAYFFQSTRIPEPAAVVSVALFGLGLMRRRRRSTMSA